MLEPKKEPLLYVDNIHKQFPGVKALDGIQFRLNKGQVHTLMGENGAGKSTLIKILSGIYPPDQGEIRLNGKPVQIHSPMDAQLKGISTVHQELNVSPNLTVAENIFLGRKLPRNRIGFIKWDELIEKAEDLIQSIGSDLDPKRVVSTLSVSEQQMVEIARAMSFQSRILIMDEPTASLTIRETEKLFSIINELKEKGIAIIYISHRMNEVFRISDWITVFRDGQFIRSVKASETNHDHLVQLMVGREIADVFPERLEVNQQEKKPLLELVDFSDNYKVHHINFNVYPGEIIGISGLVGSGRTELVNAIFGSSKKGHSGTLKIEGTPMQINSPSNAIYEGISLVPESRKEQGLCLYLSVKENIIMPVLDKYRSNGFIRWGKVEKTVDELIKRFNIKVSSPEQKMMFLSGGNQQKAIIARWIATQPKILLLDEPTRGVDVGAKQEIYTIIRELAYQGLGVIMVSSDLSEILGISDRIFVMHEGQIKKEFNYKETSQEAIMHFATGGVDKNADG